MGARQKLMLTRTTQETRRRLSLLMRRRLRRCWSYHEILMSTLADPKSRRDLRKMLRAFRRAPYTKGPSRYGAVRATLPSCQSYSVSQCSCEDCAGPFGLSGFGDHLVEPESLLLRGAQHMRTFLLASNCTRCNRQAAHHNVQFQSWARCNARSSWLRLPESSFISRFRVEALSALMTM